MVNRHQGQALGLGAWHQHPLVHHQFVTKESRRAYQMLRWYPATAPMEKLIDRIQFSWGQFPSRFQRQSHPRKPKNMGQEPFRLQSG